MVTRSDHFMEIRNTGSLEKIRVRHLEITDLPALEWDGQYSHFRRIFRETYHSMQRGLAVMWVADDVEAGIIGQVFVQLNSARPELADGWQRAYIFGFRIKEAFRNRGLGAHMLAVVEDDLRRRGFYFVTLNVGKDNPAARRFYERHGYRCVADEPGCWSYLDDADQIHEVHEPAWRMEKRLFEG